MVLTVVTCAARAQAALTPYSGAPVALPGTVQAANFDNGGEGVAYHDSTSGNTGGAYRATDVDIEANSEGGYDVGWIAAGEWINYTVSVATAGNYVATLRVAAPGGGGSLHIGFNGPSAVWKTVAIPATGGWQAWTNVSVPVTIGAGVQQITLLFDTAGFNVSSIAVTSADSGTNGSTGLSPYGGTPVSLPGVVLAANFDNGGEGVAYHDATSGNTGGAYRATDVDLERASDGGYDVGWVDAGEWLNYTVNVATAGAYVAQLRVASPGGAHMHIGFNTASNVWVELSVPATGAWQAWTTVTVPVTLGAGTQQITLLFDTPGLNVESISVSTASQTQSTSGTTWTVGAGGDLQAAIDKAQLGDTIVLQPGATYTGNFVLPEKSGGAGYVTITTSANGLPGADVRIDPSYSSLLAKIKSPNSAPAMATAPFAHHYQLQLLEFPATVQGVGDIITLGDGGPDQNTLAVVPHDLVLDRVYVHGDPSFGQKRGIALNSASTTIKNSYVAGIAAVAQDSQAIGGSNGPGPFTIANNYLEASAENVMFGGADPPIPNLVPSDITIAHNLFSKPLAWRGQSWEVKNLLELKNAQRVVIDGNVFENNWLAAQVGYAILFTPRNQDGGSPWTVVQQIQFTNNVVRHVSAGINILGTDYNAPSQKTNAITIRNNLFEDVSGARYGGNGWFVLMNGAADVTIDHNTIFADGTSDVFAGGPASTGFVFTNNIMQDNAWAIMGDGASPGNGTIATYFPGSQFFGSVIAGASPSTYPAGNFYPSSLSGVGFVDFADGNYHLSAASPFLRSGTDGTDVGANIDAINAAAGTHY